MLAPPLLQQRRPKFKPGFDTIQPRFGHSAPRVGASPGGACFHYERAQTYSLLDGVSSKEKYFSGFDPASPSSKSQLRQDIQSLQQAKEALQTGSADTHVPDHPPAPMQEVTPPQVNLEQQPASPQYFGVDISNANSCGYGNLHLNGCNHHRCFYFSLGGICCSFSGKVAHVSNT